MKNKIEENIEILLNLQRSYFKNSSVVKNIEDVTNLVVKIFKSKKKIFICGNGGSMCDAMHFAEEFTGRFNYDRAPLPVISISDPSHLSCTTNDYGYKNVFSRYIQAFGRKGDAIFLLSTSGNSPNIISAYHKAKELEISSIALLGKDGGKLKGECDYEFFVPSFLTERVQEIHMSLLHLIIRFTEETLFPNHYK